MSIQEIEEEEDENSMINRVVDIFERQSSNVNSRRGKDKDYKR